MWRSEKFRIALRSWPQKVDFERCGGIFVLILESVANRAKLEILTSPAYHQTGVISCVGDIAANLLRHDVTLGISSRGVGSLERESGQNNAVEKRMLHE